MFSIALFLVAIAFARTEAREGTYVSVMGGANAVDKIPRSSAADIGFITTGTAGYTFSNAISLEGEVGYRRNSISKYSQGPSGYIQTVSFMAHILYNFQTDYCFTPYLGAGFGSAIVHTKRTSYFWSYKNTIHRWACDIIAGIAYPISEHVDVDLQYRYFCTIHNNRENNNSIGAGLKYSF